MDRNQRSLCPGRYDEFPTLAHHLYLPCEHRTSRGTAEADKKLRLDQREFRLPPGPARGDLAAVRFLVKPALAAWLPLEVLYRVGHVALRPIHSRLSQRSIEQSSGGPDERPAFAVLFISGLFTNEDNACLARPFPEYRLCGVSVKRTRFTISRSGS